MRWKKCKNVQFIEFALSKPAMMIAKPLMDMLIRAPYLFFSSEGWNAQKIKTSPVTGPTTGQEAWDMAGLSS